MNVWQMRFPWRHRIDYYHFIITNDVCDLDYVENINHFLSFPLNKWQRFMAFCCSLEVGQRLFLQFISQVHFNLDIILINSAIKTMNCVENAIFTTATLSGRENFPDNNLGPIKSCTLTCINSYFIMLRNHRIQLPGEIPWAPLSMDFSSHSSK